MVTELAQWIDCWPIGQNGTLRTFYSPYSSQGCIFPWSINTSSIHCLAEFHLLPIEIFLHICIFFNLHIYQKIRMVPSFLKRVHCHKYFHSNDEPCTFACRKKLDSNIFGPRKGSWKASSGCVRNLHLWAERGQLSELDSRSSYAHTTCSLRLWW